eukprot:15409533-Alexandrium_andersonii.AAC.1
MHARTALKLFGCTGARSVRRNLLANARKSVVVECMRWQLTEHARASCVRRARVRACVVCASVCVCARVQ